MHTGIQLDVNGIAADAALFEEGAEGFEREEVRDAGFQPAFDDFREKVRTGGQHQNRQGNTVTPQFHSLDGQGDGKVVGAFLLHHCGELGGPVSVGIGLDQDQQLRFPLQQRAEITVIGTAGAEPQFQS